MEVHILYFLHIITIILAMKQILDSDRAVKLCFYKKKMISTYLTDGATDSILQCTGGTCLVGRILLTFFTVQTSIL